MPVAWTPYLVDLMASARTVHDAVDLSKIAEGVARMGATCGRCHQTLDRDLRLTWDDPPPESMDPRIHMLRHQWATERFWDGLVSGDDRGWRAGAAVFHEAALHADQLSAQERIDPHTQAFADALHEIGLSAAQVVDVEQRVTVLGQILTACAQCHREGGKGSATPPRL